MRATGCLGETREARCVHRWGAPSSNLPKPKVSLGSMVRAKGEGEAFRSESKCGALIMKSRWEWRWRRRRAGAHLKANGAALPSRSDPSDESADRERMVPMAKQMTKPAIRC